MKVPGQKFLFYTFSFHVRSIGKLTVLMISVALTREIFLTGTSCRYYYSDGRFEGFMSCLAFSLFL
jgi:hypothetical protein